MNHHSKLYVGLITFIAVLITALEILDGTIVSVALKTMRGNLGATIDQMTWTMTAYITAAAMTLPLAGFLSQKFGRRQLILFTVASFGIASVLCGLATNLTELILLRFIQGGVGSLLGPLSQGLLADTFDKKDMGRAMAFFGMGLMSAPILGPIVGAVVTNSLGWRWDFFINAPVVIIVLLAITVLLPKSTKKVSLPMDWQGLFWMSLAIGCFEYVLNRGNRLQWFSSDQILILTILSLFSLIVFLMHCLQRGRNSIVNLTLLKDRNFRVSVLLMMAFAMCFISINSWIPTLLEEYQHYPILMAGETMIPRGIMSLLSMMMAGILIKRISGRILVTVGLLFFTAGTYILTHFNLQVDQHFFLVANVLQGSASGLFFVPLATLAFKYIATADRDMAAGFFSFSRTLGSSLGIAIFSNIVTRQQQVSWHELSGYMRVTNPNFMHWLQANHYTLQSPQMPAVLAMNVNALAGQFAYTDAFYVVVIVILAVVPLCYFLDKPN